jgi:hypothetical protein
MTRTRANDRYWPIADILIALRNVRFRVKTGYLKVAACVSALTQHEASPPWQTALAAAQRPTTRRAAYRCFSRQRAQLPLGNNRRWGFALAHFVLRTASDAQKSQHRGHR